MAETQLRDDLTLDEATENGVSGELVPYQGYLRAAYTKTTLPVIESTYGKLIQIVLDDYAKINERREKNLKAHEGLPEKGEAMVVPIAKRDTNQQLAWLLTTLFKDPLISVRALEAGSVEIVGTDKDGNPAIVTVTNEEEALALQELVNFYLKDKIAFKKTLKVWIAELLRDGNRPPVLKVLNDPRERRIGSLNIKDTETNGVRSLQILSEPVYKSVKDGEPTRIECIPGERFYVPLPEYDIQSAPFVLQEFEEDTATIKQKIASGKYNFCLPEGETPDQETIDLVLAGLTNLEKDKKHIDGRTPADPLKQHRLFEVWHYFPFAEKGEDGQPVIVMRSFCSVFHWASKKFLNSYENPYWHGRRPFHAGFMQQRPFSFSGYSTTENVAPFQRLISQLFHLQLQNMVQSNVKVFPVRRTSSTYKFLQGKKLRPGLVIPFDEPDDINPVPLGAPIASMSAEISFLNAESEKMSVVTQYDRGNIPNRTPAATVAAVEQLAKMQPAMVLDTIRDTIGDVVKMFVQTLIQYAPTGITIPFQNPTTKAILDKVIHFPREMVVDQFAFEPTATAEDETPEARFTRHLQVVGQVDAFNSALMGISGASFKPGVPPPLMILGAKMITGRRAVAAELIRDAKLNPDDFLVTEEEITNLPAQLMQLQQQMQQAQQMGGGGMPMGDNGGLQGAGGGGAIPEAGGFGGGAGVMEGQPNDASMFGGGVPA